MEDFLKQLQLSAEAIEIYEQCLKHLSPLTYNELYSIIPDLTRSSHFNSSCSN